MNKARVVCLGPQRRDPTLRKTLDSMGIRGKVAGVTAGWEERETEDQEMSEHLDHRLINLQVYGRVEKIFEQDAELFRAMRERHDRMRSLQDLYRFQLTHQLEAARDLLARKGDASLLDPEREHAIAAVRALDEHHLRRIEEVHAEFRARFKPAERDAVIRQRDEIAEVLAECDALCVAGGHVAILLNRMRLLRVADAFSHGPLLAWSAGAMALSERIILFHDNPPQGQGNAEILEKGLGVCPNLVPLPHAKHRLRLKDKARVALFAKRFGPAQCIVLDATTRIDWNGDQWFAHPGTRKLDAAGQVDALVAA